MIKKIAPPGVCPVERCKNLASGTDMCAEHESKWRSAKPGAASKIVAGVLVTTCAHCHAPISDVNLVEQKLESNVSTLDAITEKVREFHSTCHRMKIFGAATKKDLNKIIATARKAAKEKEFSEAARR